MTRFHAEKRLRGIYDGRLFYGKDAFEGLRICDHLASGTLEEIETEIEARLEKRAAAEATVQAGRSAARSRGDGAVAEMPAPPFLGSRLVESVPLDEVFTFVNRTAFFRGQRGLEKGSRSPRGGMSERSGPDAEGGLRLVAGQRRWRRCRGVRCRRPGP